MQDINGFYLLCALVVIIGLVWAVKMTRVQRREGDSDNFRAWRFLTYVIWLVGPTLIVALGATLLYREGRNLYLKFSVGECFIFVALLVLVKVVQLVKGGDSDE